MAELRSAIFIDQLQPQTMCYLGTWIRGRLPRMGMAAAVIEVAPGLDIEPLTDVAVKHTRLQPGILVVERHFGYLEFHDRSPAVVRSASGAVLEALGASPAEAKKPEVLASTLVSRLDHQHAFLINRNKLGSMALPGESLFVLEMQPASYAILAVNEAEKAREHQGRRLPHDRRHRPRVHHRRGVRRARRLRGRDRGPGAGRMSDDARDILRELLAEALAGTNGHGVTPQVPPPPVAAVHRPGHVGGAGGRGRSGSAMAGDDDLNRFVRDLLARAGPRRDPAGRVRFTLGAGASRSSRAAGSGSAHADRPRRGHGAHGRRGGQGGRPARARAARGAHAPGAREGARAGHRDRTGESRC